MSKILYYMAITSNVLAILVLVFILLTEVILGDEFIIISLCTIPPLLALTSLYKLPDFTTRKLERDVHKARLRKELKELEG